MSHRPSQPRRCDAPGAGRAGRRDTRRVDRRGAFTLVEVLASLVLAAIILPVAMQGISVAMGLAALSRERMEAGALADSKLNELLLTQEWQDGDLTGDFGTDWPAYRWSSTSQDWDEASLTEVDVMVEWDYRGSERSVTLSTLVYTPEATE